MDEFDFSNERFRVDTDIPDFPDEQDLYVEVRVYENSLTITGDHYPGLGQSQRFEFSFAKEDIIEISATIHADPPRGTEPNWMHTFDQSEVKVTIKDKYGVVESLSIWLGNHSSYWTRALVKEIKRKLDIDIDVTDKTVSGNS